MFELLELLGYLVQGLEIVTFEIQRQYSSLFGRLEADHHKVCELQRSGTAPLTSTYVTSSPRPPPSVIVYCKQSKTGGRNRSTGNEASNTIQSTGSSLIPRLTKSTKILGMRLALFTCVLHIDPV